MRLAYLERALQWRQCRVGAPTPSRSCCWRRRAATARASIAPCRRSNGRSRSTAPPVYVRKEIVHNKHVVEQLRERGAIFVEEETEVPEGAVCVFSAHGVAPSVRANAPDARAAARSTRPARSSRRSTARRCASPRRATRSCSSATTATRRSKARWARLPSGSCSCRASRTSTSSRWRTRADRLHHADDALRRRDELDPRPSARALPEHRRSPHRRHLLRDHQPPGGRQADGRQLRSDARDRLAQLVELGASGRGGARLRHRRAPDRQRERGPRGVAHGQARRRHLLRRERSREPRRELVELLPRARVSKTSPSSTRSARTSASCCPSRSAKPSARARRPERAGPRSRVAAEARRSHERCPSRDAHADRLRPASRQRLGLGCAAPPRAARGVARGARRTSIGWCCSATCSSCATARRATRWPPRGRSSRISGGRSPGARS